MVAQRVWRGVLARRWWTELLLRETLAALHAAGGGGLLDGGLLPEAAQPPPRCGAAVAAPSLEEARAMAQEAAEAETARRSSSDGGDIAATKAGLEEAGGGGRRAVHEPRDNASSGAAAPEPVDAAGIDGGDAGLLAAHVQFTADAASKMSLDELRELAGVLSRLINHRNGVLVAQLQRRDGLLHEKSYREQLVSQLLLQVDASRALRTGSLSTVRPGAPR